MVYVLFMPSLDWLRHKMSTPPFFRLFVTKLMNMIF